MNADTRTILLLAAEALRRLEKHAKLDGLQQKISIALTLADALDRMAGAGNALGIPVSRSEALRISEETLIRAEQERVTVLEDCEGDDPRFDPEPPHPRFTPYSGRCWRCGTEDMRGAARMCRVCWSHFPKEPSK